MTTIGEALLRRSSSVAILVCKRKIVMIYRLLQYKTPNWLPERLELWFEKHTHNLCLFDITALAATLHTDAASVRPTDVRNGRLIVRKLRETTWNVLLAALSLVDLIIRAERMFFCAFWYAALRICIEWPVMTDALRRRNLRRVGRVGWIRWVVPNERRYHLCALRVPFFCAPHVHGEWIGRLLLYFFFVHKWAGKRTVFVLFVFCCALHNIHELSPNVDNPRVPHMWAPPLPPDLVAGGGATALLTALAPNPLPRQNCLFVWSSKQNPHTHARTNPHTSITVFVSVNNKPSAPAPADSSTENTPRQRAFHKHNNFRARNASQILTERPARLCAYASLP